MKTDVVYEEKLTSPVTEVLFIALTLVFLGLFGWRVSVVGWRFLTWVFLLFGFIFLFYVLNYYQLVVRITAKAIRLKFGIFTWMIPVENIRDCALDKVTFTRLGGAGIHFAMVGRRYRANFNFLDQPRVLVRLKRKQGLVWDVSFSTCQPESVMRLIEEGIN